MNGCGDELSKVTDGLIEAANTLTTGTRRCEDDAHTDFENPLATSLSVPDHGNSMSSRSVPSEDSTGKPVDSDATSDEPEAQSTPDVCCCCAQNPTVTTTSQSQLCCCDGCCSVESSVADSSATDQDEYCLAIPDPPVQLPQCCSSGPRSCCTTDPAPLSTSPQCSSPNDRDCCPGNPSTESGAPSCCSEDPCCCYRADSKCCSLDTVLACADPTASSSATGTGRLEVLKSLDMSKLFDLTSVSEAQFEQWLTSVGLLPRCRVCQCGCDMRVKSWRMRRAWVCRKRCCSSTQGFYAGTFFNGVHVALKEIFKLSFYWCVGTYSIDRVQEALRRPNGRTFSAKSMIDWYGFFRGVCTGYFRQNPVRLGGEGKRVVIDEIMVMQEQTRKVKRGREHWGFAGTEPRSSACFIELAERGLGAEALLMVIDRYVLPGTEVVSELFNKYEYDKDDKVRAAFERLAEKSSLRFVDSLAEGDESGIGETWYRFKCTHNKKMDERTVPSTHIKEFMWRRLFDGEDCMYHLWSQIAANYKF